MKELRIDCPICEITLLSKNLKRHMQSRLHKKLMSQINKEFEQQKKNEEKKS